MTAGEWTIERADRLIREAEERADLLRFQVDGWCVWPLLRAPAQVRLLGRVNPAGSSERRVRWAERARFLAADLHALAAAPRARATR